MAEQPVTRRDDAGVPPRSPRPPRLPLGQRLLDSPFLLLFAGVVIMVVFYTAWGLYEILSLKPAPLP